MPKEPPIPMLLGKIYKKLGKIDKAHLYFSQALDLESKDAQKIKGFIESLHNSTGEGDDIDIWSTQIIWNLFIILDIFIQHASQGIQETERSSAGQPTQRSRVKY